MDMNRVRNDMKETFQKFINNELSSEEENKLVILFMQYKYVNNDVNEYSDVDMLKWLSLGWYISTYLLRDELIEGEESSEEGEN